MSGHCHNQRDRVAALCKPPFATLRRGGEWGGFDRSRVGSHAADRVTHRGASFDRRGGRLGPDRGLPAIGVDVWIPGSPT